MGCDIHMQVQKRIGNEWQAVTEFAARPCSWCDGRGHYKDRPNDKCYSCKGAGAQTHVYDDRNYTVFSVLANVRNDGYVKPIADPRGLPEGVINREDSDKEGVEYIREQDFGDHSFSWLTLAELRAYDWHQTIANEGWVNAQVFAEWDAKGKKGNPSMWSSRVSGSKVEHVTHSDMREYIGRGFKTGLEQFGEMFQGKEYYTLAQWTVPLSDYCKHFLSFLETLSSLGSDEDVRLVFGFDS